MEAQLKERFKKEGTAPKALTDKPKLGWLLNDYLEAYMALAARRQTGYGSAQPLSPSDIFGYGVTHGFKSDIPFFFKCISALDNHFLEEQAKKAKAEREKSKAKSRAKSR